MALIAVAATAAHAAPLMDMIAIGARDEEQSHVFLAPIVALWLLWLRRARLRWVRRAESLWGPAIAVAGWIMSWMGFRAGVQAAWHGGALISILGAVLSLTGLRPLRLFAVAVVAAAFMVPIPGALRHQVAWPLQELATNVTHASLELFGVAAVRSGNLLIVNGEPVAVGEACNGMRLVFALVLVVYAFAFSSPLRTSMRVLLVGLSPFVAVLCNLLRLIPTSLLYGYGGAGIAQQFHDIAGWVMLLLAAVALGGVIRFFRWLELPVHTLRLASP